MTARGERRAARVRNEILESVKPEGCVGDLGITTIPAGSEESPCTYTCTPYIGCAGLEGAMAMGPTTASHSNADPSIKATRRAENLALLGAKAGFAAICATCPLGLQGQRRREAEQLRAADREADNIETQLSLAAANQATAEANARAAEAQLALAQLNAGAEHKALPAPDATSPSTDAAGAPAPSSLPPAAQ